jgi:alkaline phosphatase
MKYLFFALLLGLSVSAYSQESSKIFSHNDYLQAQPFETAYSLKVGYVEADVFLRDGKLLVAHTAIEIKQERTLDQLYFDPIKSKIQNNAGTVYPEPSLQLVLMIDLKTEGLSALNAIVDHLKKYPELTLCKTLTIAISGNVPDTSEWKAFPSFITFDGRPDKNYSKEQLERVSFISNNFRAYSKWNGKGEIPGDDVTKLKTVIASVHSQGKKIRFWAAPDVPNAWKVFMDLGVDILGTDKIEEVSGYLKNK